MAVTVRGTDIVFNDGSIQTSAANFNFFGGVNGYIKLTDTFIIQWGSISAAANAATVFTFPIAFPTTCTSVVVTHGMAGNGFVPRATSITTTGFTMTSDTFYSANPTGRKYYLAIGY